MYVFAFDIDITIYVNNLLDLVLYHTGHLKTLSRLSMMV